MNESILDSVKIGLTGLEPDYVCFDSEIVMAINSVLFILNQLGVGPATPFSITGSKEKWKDFIADVSKLEIIKEYVILKVKLIFDPPSSSSVMETYKGLVSEYEWRLNVAVDPKEE